MTPPGATTDKRSGRLHGVIGGLAGLGVSALLYVGISIGGAIGGILFLAAVVLNAPAIALGYLVDGLLVRTGLARPFPAHAYGTPRTLLAIAVFSFLQWMILASAGRAVVTALRHRKRHRGEST